MKRKAASKCINKGCSPASTVDHTTGEWALDHFGEVEKLLNAEIPQGLWHTLFYSTRDRYLQFLASGQKQGIDEVLARICKLDKMHVARYGYVPDVQITYKA